MTLKQICIHERAEMWIRHNLGMEQHDQHIWCWLVEMLIQYGNEHPIRIMESNDG
jgi:hypothetical protein